MRRVYETYPLNASPSPGTLRRDVEVPRGCWIGRAEFDPHRRGVYIHGGGFLAGSIGMYMGLVSRVADATRSWLFFCDYPRAPEQLFPAAHIAALEACTYAKHHGPFTSSTATQLFVAGDSFGAGLALATAMALRDQGLGQLLDSVVGLSSSLDVTASGDSYIRCAATDVVISAEVTRQCVEAYAPGINPKDPRLSPLFGTFQNLPPLLLQISESEAVADDSTRAALAVRQCGGQVEVQRWPGMPHVWHLFAGNLREADDAIAKAAAFIDRAGPA
jgi:acetyl esterase/lipase